MEQLKSMKQCLMAQAQSQMGNLQTVDAKELGEVIDMIKDLEEAMYYCSIVKAMEEAEKEPKQPMMNYYTERMPIDYYRRNMDMGRMYYDGGNSTVGDNSSNNSGRSSSGSRYYTESYPMDVHDYREGRSPMRRKMYMESKEMNKDKTTQMAELEKYMQELSMDLSEIINDASPEEKQILKQKMTTLVNKISV